MAISITMTESPTNPQRDDPDNFREDADDYVDWHTQTFVPEMNTVIDDLNATIQNLFVGTSTTSNTVGTGSKTWTMVEDNLAFGIGNSLRIADTADPTNNYMAGIITAYNKTTKALTVQVDTSTGSGTKTAWTMCLEPPDEYNRVRDWSTMTGAASKPLVVEHGGRYYSLNTNLADVTAKEPGVDSEWDVTYMASYEEITTSDPAWEKDPDASFILVELINGGNSGRAASDAGTPITTYGGAGGISSKRLFRASDVAASVAIVVGAGGAAVVTTTSGNGNIGGASSFGDFECHVSTLYTHAFGGNPTTLYRGGNFNGGHAAQELTYEGAPYDGGKCQIGGGGGGLALASGSGSGGESKEHGDGGDGVAEEDADSTGQAGTAPGGGGGAALSYSVTGTRTATSGAGARGAVRIWQW